MGRGVSRGVFVAALVLAALLLPEPSSAAAKGAGAPTFRQYTEQGIHYWRKRKLEPARRALEQARSLPGGDSDFDTLFNLAHVYFALLQPEEAIPVAKRCTETTPAGPQLEQCRSLLKSLMEGFGEVRFVPIPAQQELTSGEIRLKSRSELINPKKKEIFEGIAERLAAGPVPLPHTLFLPYGTYLANDTAFVVERGNEPSEVQLFFAPAIPPLAAVPDEPAKPSLSPWWYVGAAALVVGAGTTAAVLLLGGPAEPQPVRVGEIRFLEPPAHPGGPTD